MNYITKQEEFENNELLKNNKVNLIDNHLKIEQKNDLINNNN